MAADGRSRTFRHYGGQVTRALLPMCLVGPWAAPHGLCLEPNYHSLRAGRHRPLTADGQVVGVATDGRSDWLSDADQDGREGCKATGLGTQDYCAVGQDRPRKPHAWLRAQGATDASWNGRSWVADLLHAWLLQHHAGAQRLSDGPSHALQPGLVGGSDALPGERAGAAAICGYRFKRGHNRRHHVLSILIGNSSSRTYTEASGYPPEVHAA